MQLAVLLELLLELLFLLVDFLPLLLDGQCFELELPLQVADHVFLAVLVLILAERVLALSSLGIHRLTKIAREALP